MADGSTIGSDDLPGELAAAARAAPRPTLRMWGTGGTSPAGATAPFPAPVGAAPGTASPPGPAVRSSGEAATTRSAPGLAAELDALERDRLIAALTSAGGNKSYAARLLGFRRSTFCSKLKKYGIE
jgi:transcriptional regulator of acetoin/glycerol metabolism